MTITTSGTGKAADFLNSIGVNTRAGDSLDGYENTTLVIQSLKFLGVDKVRDGFTQFDKAAPALEALADAGIQFDFRVRYGLPQQGEAGLTAFLKAVNVFNSEHPGSILSIEGLNEIDLNSFSYNGSSTAEAAAAFQKDLYTAIKSDAGLSDIKVVNLSIGYDSSSAYSAVGNLGAYSDYANAHIYTHTGKAADGQMERTLGIAKGASQGDPLIITELGHTTLKSEPGIGSDETAQAKLVLTNLFNAYENGAEQTYLYELLDTPGSMSRGEKEAHFGLFNADGSPKLAATAIHNMNAILSAGDSGDTSGSAALNYSLQGTSADTHSMLLQKSGGVSDLVLWQDTTVWNDVTDTGINNPVRKITVTLDHVEPVVRIYDPLTGTTPIATYYNVSSFTVSLVDHPLIVEVGSRPSSLPEGNQPAPEQDLVITGDQLIAKIDDLAKSSIHSITLDGGNVLSVSTVVTMKYIIENYSDVLAKIEGGYTFSVTTPQSTWKKTDYFDASGKSIETITYGLKGDTIVSKVVSYPDGSKENYSYGITGRTYVTEKQVMDAKGNLVAIDRIHADGSYDYREMRNADGSKQYQYYDVAGHLLNDVTITADGTNRTLSYDPQTGKLARELVVESNGERSTTNYTNGVKTFAEIIHADGGKETLTYDATSGKLLTDIVKYADGGSLSKIYKAGVLSASYERDADGSGINYSYGITGKSYVTEKQTVDAKGNVVAIDRYHADGTFDYQEQRGSDGSKHYVYYNAGGKILNDVTIDGTGTTTLSYDAVTGKLYRQMVQDKNGQLSTTSFNADGSKTGTEITRADGGKESITYDVATGKILTDIVKYADGSSATKIYKAGVLSANYERAADGSGVNYTYGITGKSFVTEKQTVDAKGNVTAIARYHADGTLDYQEDRSADGGKHFAYYTASGKLLNDVTVDTSGKTTTLNYDATTGKLYRQMVQEKDGSQSSTSFNGSGAKTGTDITYADGSKGTLTYDVTTGKLINDITKYVDGGSVTKVYKAGALAASYERKADGTGVNYGYGITGKSYVTEKQTVDAKGNVTAIARYHSDGTLDYQELRDADGSKHFLYYTTAGKILNDVTVTSTATTTLNYDATTGKLYRQMVQDKDGSFSTTYFNTSGVKTTTEITRADGSKENIAYDLSSGKVATDVLKYADGSSVTKVFKAGVLAASYERKADGTGANYGYGITGKTYVTEKQTVDAKGNVTGIARYHSDGTLDYQELRDADGSKHFLYYNTAGKILNDVTVTSTATTTLSYDAATNKLYREMVQDKDGSFSTTYFNTGGAKTTTEINHANGSKETLSYDLTSGKVATDVLKYSDGSSVTKVFKAGVLSSSYDRAPDGSGHNYAYNVVDKTYVTEKQTVDTKGAITGIERLHADGTLDYQEARYADGSKLIVNYTAEGTMLNRSSIHSDGTRDVEYFLQNGSGDIRHDVYDAKLATLSSDTIHLNGSHNVTLYADGQTVHGGAEDDIFNLRGMKFASVVFEGGNDTISNINLAGGDHIVLQKTWAESFSDLHMSQSGSNVVISFDHDNTILIQNTQLSSLHSDAFVFA